jgi:uncharacterized protein YndB with AHSA1/START domain
METLVYKIDISATPEKVWQSLWQLENYKIWTNPFCEGSYYKTDSFTEGSKIHLLTPSGEGMYSIIDRIEENHFLAFKHLGDIKNFEETPMTNETESWSGAMETYTLNKTDSGTELIVNVDTLEKYIDFMNTTFPLALNELKRISEN